MGEILLLEKGLEVNSFSSLGVDRATRLGISLIGKIRADLCQFVARRDIARDRYRVACVALPLSHTVRALLAGAVDDLDDAIAVAEEQIETIQAAEVAAHDRAARRSANRAAIDAATSAPFATRALVLAAAARTNATMRREVTCEDSHRRGLVARWDRRLGAARRSQTVCASQVTSAVRRTPRARARRRAAGHRPARAATSDGGPSAPSDPAPHSRLASPRHRSVVSPVTVAGGAA